MSVKQVFVANPHGFCAGVQRAVNAIERALGVCDCPIYCLNEIVHNRQVVDSLRARGVEFVTSVTSVPAGACLVFSAHGVPPTVRQEAEARGLRIVDATCPFVEKVHAEVRRFAADGFTVLLIGHRKHDEIVGVHGEAPESVIVVENAAEARRVEVPDAERVAVVTQTTLSVDESMRVVGVLRRRFPGILLSPQANICHATSSRQVAVKELALRTDVVLVLGSVNSSNTRRLAEVAEDCGVTAHLVSDLSAMAGLDLDGSPNVGVTAGASTPGSFVDEVLRALAGRGFGDIQSLAASTEDARFAPLG